MFLELSTPWVIAFVIYSLSMIYLYEWNLKKLAPMFKKENAELHKQNPAFERPDKEWMTCRPLYYLMMWTMVPRAILGISCFALLALFSFVNSFGIEKSLNFRYSKIRLWIVMAVYNVLGRLIHLAFAVLWITNSRKVICYKKYLGEDWVPDFDGPCGTCVSNH